MNAPEIDRDDDLDDDRDAGLDEIEEDFAPVDLVEAVIGLLVAGESRNAVARALRITREEVDARVAEATAEAEAEALNEREYIVREKVRSLTRQASVVELPESEAGRLAFLLALAGLELEMIAWTRRRQGVA